eukprot:GILI01005058.1.p1 GENE.GILI01005058.1~~GILI01005058.1.p1  ORF type:complete len:463 (-),score=156.24 GILI01005058.1:207-1514(-)
MESARRRINCISTHLAPAAGHTLSPNATATPSLDRMVASSDFFQFDDLLTADERALRLRVRQFMETEVLPKVNHYYERAEFPFELVPKIRDLGLCGTSIKGYGCPGLSHMASMLITLEMARIDASIATFFLVHCCLGMSSIAELGSEEQKNYYLPKMARLEMIGAFGLTEPDFGSDATGLQTTARKVEGGWIINGQKRWIGNATIGDVIIIWARNTTTNQVNGFIVEKGSKGLRCEKIQNKSALRIVQNADIYLEDVFVPDNKRLPKADDFATGVGKILQYSRIAVAWLPPGMCMGIYDHALQYAKKRDQFGTPLASFQLTQEKLVRMLGTIQAMLLMAWRVSKMHSEGKMTVTHVGLAKSWNSLRGREVAALGREIIGGNGIVYDWHVARFFNDMEAIYTYEGTYDVNALVVGREVTGIAAFKAPAVPKKAKKH